MWKNSDLLYMQLLNSNMGGNSFADKLWLVEYEITP